ncbi:MAG: caspase family protein [Hyphomicrobiaceae bacterium]
MAALCCALLFALVATAVPSLAEKRIALVIGNGKYARDPLPNPPRDAALIARTLKGVDFEVIEVIDADRQAMQTALIEFGRKLAQADSVGVFYYAGHGVQVNGDNYLLPVDVDIRTEAEVRLQGVNLNEILITLRPQNTRLAVAVLDACRNNPFVGLTRGLSRGLAPVSAPAGTLIAFSTAPGEVALDGDGQNSPYTEALARAIPTPGLAIEEVFKRTRQSVMQATARAQVPWEHSSLVGRFLFVPETNARPDGRDAIAGQTPDVRLAEIGDWERIKDSENAGDFKAFLKRYPSGAFAELANYKVKQLAAQPSAWSWWVPSVVAAVRPREAGRAQAEELYARALRFEAEKKTAADLEHARSLYQAAAEAGLAPAMFRLGRLIEREASAKRKAGGGKAAYKTQLAAAAAWYAKAAEQAHPGAQHALGTLHEFGEGVGRDLAEALRLYKLAADAGDAGGMTSLAFLYASGKGVHRNHETARRWYQRAAEAGSARAMYNLALMQLSRKGGPVDVPQATKWLTEAAKSGHAGAMRQLAVFYEEGRGLSRSTDNAADFLLKAYRAGDADARSDLFDRNRRWSRSTRKAIQRQLKADGLYTGVVHGVFNASTRRALTRYRATR